MLALLAALALAQAPPELERAWPLPIQAPGSSAPCLACHPRQAQAWRGSVHARASSPGLWGQLPTSGPHTGDSLACLLCHAPITAAQPWRVPQGLRPAPGPGGPAERWTAALAGREAPPNPALDEQARAEGVGCLACHWREGAVLGPPGPAPSAAARAAHPVRQDPLLARPGFCAACHQFFDPAARVAGHPLEDTLGELQASLWGPGGATCQGCHLSAGHGMPGIHSPDLVAASVEARLELAGRRGRLVLSNDAVGHAFPSYATPRVLLEVQPLDAQGRPLGPARQLRLGRRVAFQGGAWAQQEDSRLLPRAQAELAFDLADSPAVAVEARVRVEPDAGYLALYEGLLAGEGLPEGRRRLLREALARARASGYEIFRAQRPLAPGGP